MNPISPDIRPLVAESSTAESTTVEVVMNDMRDGVVYIPAYQRDTDQWGDDTKSLFIESVINNLTVPAFFFEVVLKDGVERSEVVDGQQRLTTLQKFYEGSFRLVAADEVPYITPNSVHYAGRTYAELPLQYQQALKKYRLATIKLRNIENFRLEIFRRINQGGTPLSGQDIRLAYYGAKSPSVTFIRMAGIFDTSRPASQRTLENAKKEHGLDFPWTEKQLETWRDWWEDKEIAKGQTASEMFLWSLVAANADPLGKLLENSGTLATLNVKYNRTADEALDAFCAQLQYQDSHPDSPALLIGQADIREKFFPYFVKVVDTVLGSVGVSTRVTKHRVLASVVGAAYAAHVDLTKLDKTRWLRLVDLVRDPAGTAKGVGVTLPQSKGRWDGLKGYHAQLLAMRDAVRKVLA